MGLRNRANLARFGLFAGILSMILSHVGLFDEIGEDGGGATVAFILGAAFSLLCAAMMPGPGAR